MCYRKGTLRHAEHLSSIVQVRKVTSATNECNIKNLFGLPSMLHFPGLFSLKIVAAVASILRKLWLWTYTSWNWRILCVHTKVAVALTIIHASSASPGKSCASPKEIHSSSRQARGSGLKHKRHQQKAAQKTRGKSECTSCIRPQDVRVVTLFKPPSRKTSRCYSVSYFLDLFGHFLAATRKFWCFGSKEMLMSAYKANFD